MHLYCIFNQLQRLSRWQLRSLRMMLCEHMQGTSWGLTLTIWQIPGRQASMVSGLQTYEATSTSCCTRVDMCSHVSQMLKSPRIGVPALKRMPVLKDIQLQISFESAAYLDFVRPRGQYNVWAFGEEFSLNCRHLEC